MAKDTNATKAVGLLIEVANADTVYRDLYLKRARQLLSATLDESAYREIRRERALGILAKLAKFRTEPTEDSQCS
jgi:hypothetical protein